VMPQETQITPVRVFHLCEVAELREPFDVVFLAVKAYDTRWACELIKPLVAEHGLVIGLQNGMTIDDVADIMGTERTIGAVVEVSSNMMSPGRVERHTPPSGSWFALGGLWPGAGPRADEVRAILGAAGTVTIADDIRSAKWMKLIANSAEVVTSAILGLPLLEAAKIEGMHQFMVDVGREAARICLASGHRIVPIFGMESHDDPDVYAEMLLQKIYTSFSLPTTKTAVLQDWEKGRRSEFEQMNGEIVRSASALGLAAPLNTLVVELAREVESGALRIGPENARLLPL
jgi:2-dehydropantoate 2-reductase